MKNEGGGLFLGGLQTVYVNSVWKSIINVSAKTMHYILFFTAGPKICRYVEACICGCAQSMTVIVCKSLWCDHLLEVLLRYQTYTPSPLQHALLSYSSILTIWYHCILCVCARELENLKNSNISDTRHLEISKYPTWSLSKQSTSQSPVCSKQFRPTDTQKWGMSLPGPVTESAEPGLIH